jgi:hypothetical protein
VKQIEGDGTNFSYSIAQLHLSSIYQHLDNDRFRSDWREKLSVDLSAHECGSCEGARNEEQPDRGPAVCVLQRADDQQTDGGSDGTTSVDKTCDSSQRLVASMDGGMRRQIRGNGGGDDIVRSGNDLEEHRS